MTKLEGTYRAYGPQLRIREEQAEMIGRVNQVLALAQRDRVLMTLRQVYYKFVKNGWFANEDANYERLGRAVARGRMVGLIPWDQIEDMERDLYGTNIHEAPEQLLSGLADKYSRDLWADQPWRPEVWMEKKGTLKVVGAICAELRVDYFACKGYNSLTEAWKAGQRLSGYVEKGQRPIIFYIGDHDPSGLDMIRNNREQLETFVGVPITVVPLALTWEQVQKFGPELPPNPAKQKDARLPQYISYMEDMGAEDPEVSWEVEALEPTFIRRLISDNVSRIRDEVLWDQALRKEIEDKRWLRTMAGEL